MVENISYSGNINVKREEGASLPSSSKSQETQETKGAAEVKEQKPVVKEQLKAKDIVEKQERIDPKELNEAIADLNEKLSLSNREIVFKTESKINKNYISVIDRESQEVIKEWPPKEVRKFLVGLKELEDQLATNKDIKSLILNLEV